MNKSKDEFYTTCPQRMIQKASFYSRNLSKLYELPKANSKSMYVEQLAKTQKEFIEYAIHGSKSQLDLYRKKEQEDLKLRALYEKKIKEGLQKVQKNEIQIYKKKEKLAENYNKHLDQTYRRYEDVQKRHRQSQKQQAYKLRKQLNEFYEKQQERKKIAQLKQVQVGTEYQKAVDRLNKIQQRNQQYSLKAEAELDKELKKNNHYHQILGIKRRTVSVINQNKSQIRDKNHSIFSERENYFIQKYGYNETGSIQAWKHIDQDCRKTKSRLSDFFKKRVEKWSMDKKRVDAAKAEVPNRCLNILEKTSKSAFRSTVSSFRNSSLEWHSTVRKNKSLIKENDQTKKDEIMSLHLDMRLKNNSSYRVREKMESMRHHAHKLANAYL